MKLHRRRRLARRPRREVPSVRVQALTALLAAALVGGCGDDSTAGSGGSGGSASTAGEGGGAMAATTAGGEGTGGDGSGGDGSYTTECGTFEPPDGPTDSVFPDDPASADIVASCEAFCDAFAAVCDNGGFFRDDCIDDCRLRACAICPGTLVPLVDCEASETDVATCGCQDGIPVCEQPGACSEEQAATSQCGG
jgi:hypothetical protein